MVRVRSHELLEERPGGAREPAQQQPVGYIQRARRFDRRLIQPGGDGRRGEPIGDDRRGGGPVSARLPRPRHGRQRAERRDRGHAAQQPAG